MKKTAKPMVTLKKRGLLLVLSVFLLASSQDVVAMTTETPAAESGILTLDVDGLAVIQGPEEPPSIQETLVAVCASRGYGEDCAKVLLGMAWKESNFIGTAIGDRGKARGWFQIWPKHHTGTLKGIMAARHPEITTVIGCTEDLACSADWTISYLERNHYPKYVKYAVQCHNGCNIANGYAASALRHGVRLWNDEKSIQVAVK